MSWIDSLTFWKKKEPDFSLPDIDSSTPEPPLPESHLQQESHLQPENFRAPEPMRWTPPSQPMTVTPMPSAFQQQGQQNTQLLDKDVQLISAKLDTIKAQLENISARLARLERIAEQERYQ